jgi:tetratricopeptide (TPR) repeat protein
MKIKWMLLALTLAFCWAVNAQQNQQLVRQYDSPLLQPNRFNSALSGVMDADYFAVRKELLAMQPEIAWYPANQQAYYWYYRALSAWKLGLTSDNVFPSLENVWTLKPALSESQLFEILMTMKDIARDYQFFDKAIEYMDEIKRLVGEPPAAQSNTITPIDAAYAIAHHEVGENEKAIKYMKEVIRLTLLNGDKPTRHWWQMLVSAQVELGDIASAIKTQKELMAVHPHRNSQMHLEYLHILVTQK